MDRAKMTNGEIRPTALSFLKVFRENGKDETIIITQKNKAK